MVSFNTATRTYNTRGKTFGIEKKILRTMLNVLGNPPVRISLWNGEEITTQSGVPSFRISIHDRKTLYRLMVHPDLYFGEAYSNGSIRVDGDLVLFLETIYRQMSENPGNSILNDSLSRIVNRPRLNSISGSRDNIHHHYDIGNEFYRCWLDKSMQYTCAYFPSPETTLEEAQTAKMEHICRKLQLRPGETVVEAGCGWGGLARHMARYHGVKVRAYNISHQQVLYARETAEREGLSDSVEYIEDDYRNISGRYDAFVSVGMLEHVGKKNYSELGNIIKHSLKDHGRGLIHSIGRNRASLMNAWVEKRIFPGAYPPTLREMMEILEPCSFSVVDVENLRLHYAATLRHWLERFEKSREDIRKMFDERFIRAWRLYLAGSIASFTTGHLQLFQVLFTQPSKNDISLTRAHLYREN